jgi:hypothetical protein
MAFAGRGALVISLDLEGWWGVRDNISATSYRNHLEGETQASLATLQLFEERGIKATWAIVGLFMTDGARSADEAKPSLAPGYLNSRMDPFADLEGPHRYNPDLVRTLVASPSQEVATHTFSHYYCLEPGASVQSFEADLKAWAQVASTFGVQMRSVVFPRNQYHPDFLRVLAANGIKAFRGNPNTWFWQPKRSDTTLRRLTRLTDAYIPLPKGRKTHPVPPKVINVPATRFLRPCDDESRTLTRLREKRIESEMSAAFHNGKDFHLWWHPHNFGAKLDQNLSSLNRILDTYDRIGKSEATTLTMAEVADRDTRLGR